MFDFIKSAMGALGGPMSAVVDLAGDTLGLPPLLKNSIKAAVGASTGNLVMVADGAMGVMGELKKNPGAETEFRPSQEKALARDGYAPEPAQAELGALASRKGGYLDANVLEYRDALRALAANFSLLDTLDGKQNGKFNVRTLESAARNSNLSPQMRDTINFLLDHPEYLRLVDTANKGGKPDGTISREDVQKALRKVNDEIAHYGVFDKSGPTPPASPPPSAQPPQVTAPVKDKDEDKDKEPRAPSTSTRPPKGKESSASIDNILKNPRLSVEEKIQAILMEITRDTDEEILGVMKEMATIRDEHAKLGTDQKSKSRAAKLDTNMQELELRLQKLMEKRKQMFDLMSTMSTKYNEMAKTAIQNIARA